MGIVLLSSPVSPAALTSRVAITSFHEFNTEKKTSLFPSGSIPSSGYTLTCASAKKKGWATLEGHEEKGNCFCLQLHRFMLEQSDSKTMLSEILAFPLG